MEVRSSPNDVSGTKIKNELEIGSLPTLATPNEQTSEKAPLEKSAAQKSRKRLMAQQSKSLTNAVMVPSVSYVSKSSSASDQSSVVQKSFLDQLLTEQTKMFDRTVRKQSPQLGPPFAVGSSVLTSSVPSAAKIMGSSETRQPPQGGLLDDRAVSGPTSGMGDCAQPHSARKGQTSDAGSLGFVVSSSCLVIFVALI